jgi:hypothetical protein
VKLLDYLDERAKRRERKFRALLEAGRPLGLLDRLPGWPSEQFLIAGSILAMFAISYANQTNDETLKGALIAGFAGAWGYFLGSSDAGKRAGDRSDAALDIAKSAVDSIPSAPPSTPDVTLQPGDRVEVEAEEKD